MKTRLTWLLRLIALNILVISASLAFAQELPLPQTPNLPDGFELVEGDIILPIEAARGRATYEATKWPSGIVPYSFSGTISPTEQSQMRAAMDSWQEVAGVTFVPRTSQSNYIYIIEDGGNYSYIGMIGGEQPVSIYNWTYKYIIMHELAHALGLWHEQSRPDRDQYITIKWANITPGTEHNFYIRNTASTVGGYDFESIMHYDDYAFSKNGKRTIVAKPAYSSFQNVIGHLSYLSTKDAAGMRKLYPKPVVTGDVYGKAFPISTMDYYTTSFSTASFTKSANEPNSTCSDMAGKTVWFKVTPARDRVLSIYAGGFDTVLAVYTGTPGSWKQHACADRNFDGTVAEQVMVNAKAGTTYYIVVGGWNGASGNLTLDVFSYRNLLKNGDFQWGKTNWTVKSSPVKPVNDKVGCGATINAVHGSRCAFRFTGGAGENSSIVQNIAASTLKGMSFSAGQAYTLWVNATSSDGGYALNATVNVTYQDGSTQQLINMALTPNIVPTYSQFTDSGALSRSDVKKFTVTITSTSAAGNTVWVDNIQLRGPSGTPLRIEPAQPAYIIGGQTR